jgi:hypothetical protein
MKYILMINMKIIDTMGLSDAKISQNIVVQDICDVL